MPETLKPLLCCCDLKPLGLLFQAWDCEGGAMTSPDEEQGQHYLRALCLLQDANVPYGLVILRLCVFLCGMVIMNLLSPIKIL